MQSTFLVYDFYDPTMTPWILALSLQPSSATASSAAASASSRSRLSWSRSWAASISWQRSSSSSSTLPACSGLRHDLCRCLRLPVHPRRRVRFLHDLRHQARLYSNEAGIGSAPNAAAVADVSHPVKQGLVQMLSVFIDTLLVCSATAFMGLFSGVPITKEAAGAAYVQGAASAVFGGFGPLLITVCMLLFGFSTLIGNLYYVDNCIRFIHKGLRLRASSIPSASSASPLSSSAPACPWLPFGLLPTS